MRLTDLHEAQYSRDSDLLKRYDEFIDSRFIRDLEGTNITPNLIVTDASVFIDINNEHVAYFSFDSNNPFDNELTIQVPCPKFRCEAKIGSKCRGYSHQATRPHLDRFNKAGQGMKEGTITSREAQMAVSFVKSVLKKHNLPFKKVYPGYEADGFQVYVEHPSLGSAKS